ncbi:hypothetical protein J3F83DRAFT_410079 [Trichoderma novae-zelandiae]
MWWLASSFLVGRITARMFPSTTNTCPQTVAQTGLVVRLSTKFLPSCGVGAPYIEDLEINSVSNALVACRSVRSNVPGTVMLRLLSLWKTGMVSLNNLPQLLSFSPHPVLSISCSHASLTWQTLME